MLILSRPLSKLSFDLGERHTFIHTISKGANGLLGYPQRGRTARWVGLGGRTGKGGDLSGRREAGSGFPSHKGPASANTCVRSFMAAARPAGTAGELEMKHTHEQGLETWQLKGR